VSLPSAASARESPNVVARRSVQVEAGTLDVLLHRRVLHSSVRVEVVLDVVELTPLEVRQWRARIERLYNACGCGVAAAFLVASLPALAVIFVAAPRGLSVLTVPGVVLLVAVPVSATINGKFIGLARARGELKRAVDELSSLVASRTV
jgi:hypothetical protein